MVRRRLLLTGLFVVAGLTALPRAGSAQRLADLAPAGPTSTAGALQWSPAPLPPVPALPRASAAAARPRRWGWFALGGAVVGFGSVVALAFAHCDAGCRDDGGAARGIVLVGPLGAGLGALVGAGVGLVVDAQRR